MSLGEGEIARGDIGGRGDLGEEGTEGMCEESAEGMYEESEEVWMTSSFESEMG